MISTLSILLLIAWQLVVTDGLDCYNCTSISNITDCHQFTQCSGDDYCYTETTGFDDQTRYTLGCRSKQICLSPTTTQPDINIVGRNAVPHVDCTQCCGIDFCNKQLCIHPGTSGGCEDDPTFNCPQVASLFDICSDIHHAKLKCKKFCGLCTLVHGKWAGWSSWGTCSVTCGVGLERRDRSCSNPYPGPHGDPCFGDTRDDRVCFNRACAEGKWSVWSTWGTCSASCLGGLSKRLRTCNNPSPSQYGRDCVGNTEETRICNTHYCPDVHNGGWSSWATWSICSKNCEDGEQTRQRTCNNPSPGPFGRACSGTDWQTKACNIRPCTNGFWSSWSTWGTCSASCLGGLSKRTRTCNNPSPSQYGHSCVGNADDTKICNTHYCSDVRNGAWSGWSSVSCNGGQQTRQRSCTNPSPSPFGHACSGTDWQTKSCNVINCNFLTIRDGHWSSWSTWTTCPSSCYGQRTRQRHCTNPTRLGHTCHGNDQQTKSCATANCATIQIRLTHGSYGRVEVKVNGQWGTVCDDGFTVNSGKVVCRMMGRSTTHVTVYGGAHYGQGSGTIWLDDVVCQGTEHTILDCSHQSLGTENCGHHEDVSVVCG